MADSSPLVQAFYSSFQEGGVGGEEGSSWTSYLDKWDFGDVLKAVFQKVEEDSSYSRNFALFCSSIKQNIRDPENKHVKLVKDLVARIEAFEKALRDNTGKDQDLNTNKAVLSVIGELYNYNVVPIQVIHGCLQSLIKHGDDLCLEGVCTLLEVAGDKLEWQTEECFKRWPSDVLARIAHVDEYYFAINHIMLGNTELEDSTRDRLEATMRTRGEHLFKDISYGVRK